MSCSNGYDPIYSWKHDCCLCRQARKIIENLRRQILNENPDFDDVRIYQKAGGLNGWRSFFWWIWFFRTYKYSRMESFIKGIKSFMGYDVAIPWERREED